MRCGVFGVTTVCNICFDGFSKDGARNVKFVTEIDPIPVVSFLLGKSPASVCYCMPTLRNSLSVPSSKAMVEH